MTYEKTDCSTRSQTCARQRLASIRESLEDTSKLLSADVHNAALAYYRNIKLVAQQNVPGTTHIHKDLASQFPGRPSSVTEETGEQQQ